VTSRFLRHNNLYTWSWPVSPKHVVTIKRKQRENINRRCTPWTYGRRVVAKSGSATPPLVGDLGELPETTQSVFRQYVITLDYLSLFISYTVATSWNAILLFLARHNGPISVRETRLFWLWGVLSFPLVLCAYGFCLLYIYIYIYIFTRKHDGIPSIPIILQFSCFVRCSK
jgi:hypothetical protein